MRIKKRYQGKVPVSCQSHCACIVESASCEFIYILTIIFAKSQDFFHELISGEKPEISFSPQKNYQRSDSKKSSRCTIRMPFSIPTSMLFVVTIYFG